MNNDSSKTTRLSRSSGLRSKSPTAGRSIATLLAIVALLAAVYQVAAAASFEAASSIFSIEPASGSDASPAAPAARNVTATPPSSTVSRATEPTCIEVSYTPPTATSPQTGELCAPADPGRAIGVVLVHGGGESGGARSDTAAWAAFYQSQGIVTLAISYELSTPNATAATWPRPEQQVKAAAQYLRSVAPNPVEQVLAHGWSAGARLVAVAWTTSSDPTFAGDELWTGVSDRIDAAILFYGYYDGFVFSGPGYYPDVLPTQAVPLAAVDQATGPAFIAHGVGDFLVSAQQSETLANAATAEGIEHELHLVVDQPGHAFDGYGADELTPAGLALADSLTSFLANLGI